MPQYKRRRPWEKRGEIGTGAPPESPTAGWRIDYSTTVGANTWHYLNVYVPARVSDVRVVVKQYPDGSFWCSLSRCAARKRKKLHACDDSYAGCLHEQFTRNAVRGVFVPPTDAPSTHTDRDAPPDVSSDPEPEDQPWLDEEINPPPF